MTLNVVADVTAHITVQQVWLLVARDCLDCQKQHWPEHKPQCIETSKPYKVDGYIGGGTTRGFAEFLTKRMNYMEKEHEKTEKRDPVTGIRKYPPKFRDMSKQRGTSERKNRPKSVLFNVKDRSIYQADKYQTLLKGSKKTLKKHVATFGVEDLETLITMLLDKTF
jgi:hypothetical protein